MKRTGELLKKAREERRLSLHEVALYLKINSRVLQAIEEGDQSQLPARTFLRGFVQSYAKFLKLDSQVVLQVFTEEMAPPRAAPAPHTGSDPAPETPNHASKDSSTTETQKEDEENAEIDIINLEKSILTQSQVSQDKLGFKTIAVSIVGLLLVVILYFTNNLIKKYQKEAQIDPLVDLVVAENTEATPGLKKVDNTPSPNEAPPNSPTPTQNNSTAQNSVQTNTTTVANTLISPIAVTKPPLETKPKLPEKMPEKTPEKPVEKPIAVTPPPQPTPPPPAAQVPPPKKEEPKAPEGRLVEVIVEANDAVEIEYSSSKTNPQKMVLKADQVHTFKSRSGVKLKISNGGAVNIIMNGRDLGAPGASGQPIQLTY